MNAGQTTSPATVLAAIFGDGVGWRSLCSLKTGADDFRTESMHTDIEELLDAAAKVNAQGRETWFSVHPMAVKPALRGGADDVTSVSVLIADIDWLDTEAHKGTENPPEAEVRRIVDGLILAPRIVINTGHGLHLYWPMSEAVSADEGKALQAGIDAMLADKGLKNDRPDLASVLRVPGTINYKSDPVPVTVEKFTANTVPIVTARQRLAGSTSGSPISPRSKAKGTTDRGLEDVLKRLDDAGRDQDAEALRVICEAHGGHHPFLKADHLSVTRPDKKAGTSATIGYVGPGVVKMMSSAWPGFDQHGRYVVDSAGDKLISADTEEAPLSTTTVQDGDDSAAPSTPPARPKAVTEPCTLDHAHQVARRWLGAEYDMEAFDVTLAAAACEQLDGDPPWLLVISGSGNAKTETVQTLGGAGAFVTSTITSVGALLSGSPKKETGSDSTGGLLRKIGDRGIVVIKDVTSILSMDRNARAEVLAALREVYDGKWERNIGTDGGRTLTWNGRIVVIGAVTSAWDRAHAVVSAMGDRFVLIRMDSRAGRMTAGRQAIANTGSEIDMRAELAQVAGGVLASVDPSKAIKLDAAETERLLAAANVVTIARTAVDFDYRGNVEEAHAPEMPTRFAKQIEQIVRGAVAIGCERDHAMHLAIRCARDSMPPMRLAILLDVAKHPHATPTEVRKRIGKPRTTVDRQLQALHGLDLVVLEEEEDTHTGKTTWRYSLADDIDPDVLDPGPSPDLLVSDFGYLA